MRIYMTRTFWRATSVIISNVGSSHVIACYCKDIEITILLLQVINSLLLVLHILHGLDALLC
jgi:hypothetical protein